MSEFKEWKGSKPCKHGTQPIQRCSTCSPEEPRVKEFPVMSGAMGRRNIPWWLAEEAYLEYSKLYGSEQSLERLAERGGFYVEEMHDLRPGWKEAASGVEAYELFVKAAEETIARADDHADSYISQPIRTALAVLRERLK